MKKNRTELIFTIFRLIGDILVIHFSYILAFHIRFEQIATSNINAYYRNIPFIIIFSIIIFQLYNLYTEQTRKPLSDIFYAFIPATIIITLFSVTLSYYFQTYKFPRSIFLIVLPILFIFLIIWRYFLLVIQKKFVGTMDIILIGSKISTDKLKDNIYNFTNNGFNIKKIISKESFEKLNQKKKRELLNEISPEIIFITSDISIKDKKELFYISLENNWEISLVPEFYEIMIAGGRLNQIGEFPVYNIKSLKENGSSFLKRTVDILISAISLIILSPLIFIISMVIKLNSGGTIFYKQKRISKNGKEFCVYKFRTMIYNAEKNTGPVLSNNNDSRITKVGKLLRKTRMDEIPQLFNVLKGEMSLIGPRPERPYFVDQYKQKIENYEYRHHVKSGITGLAQIYGFYSTDPEEKLRMDLIYANNNNIFFDLKIILNTLKVILIGKKAE